MKEKSKKAVQGTNADQKTVEEHRSVKEVGLGGYTASACRKSNGGLHTRLNSAGVPCKSERQEIGRLEHRPG